LRGLRESWDRPWVSTLKRIGQRRSVVLGYHGVGHARLRDDTSLLQLSPTRFRTQVELLARAGFRFVTLAELALRADGGVPEPGLAAITFDDGMRSNRTAALPILSEYGIPATVYVTIGFIGGQNPWIGSPEAAQMMNEAELCELAGAGWELGAHTISHPDLSTLDYEACQHEIVGSKVALEDITGAPVQTFAYPFGRYGSPALAAVRDAGMLAAVTTGSGRWDRFEITRAMVGAIDPLAIVLLKLTDRYEPIMRTPLVRGARAGSKRLRNVGRPRTAPGADLQA
jgi:peptidoglycan/xylan/chitin deacetylase (PgdA/CDA1 family)